MRIITWIDCQTGLNDKQKTTAVYLWLTRRAADFARVCMDRYTALESSRSKHDAWPIWPVLKKEIEDHFRIDVLKEEAYHKLMAFKQGKLLIEVFSQQFEIYQLDSEIPDETTLRFYCKNMDYNIYFQLLLRQPPLAKSLTDWQDQAIAVGKTFNQMCLECSKIPVD